MAAGGPAMATLYDDLARQIGEFATGVTDEQVMSVVQAIVSEKAAFEVIAAAALGAGLLRWEGMRPDFSDVACVCWRYVTSLMRRTSRAMFSSLVVIDFYQWAAFGRSQRLMQ